MFLTNHTPDALGPVWERHFTHAPSIYLSRSLVRARFPAERYQTAVRVRWVRADDGERLATAT